MQPMTERAKQIIEELKIKFKELKEIKDKLFRAQLYMNELEEGAIEK